MSRSHGFKLKCEVCGVVFVKAHAKGPWPSTCGPKCRKAKSRAVTRAARPGPIRDESASELENRREVIGQDSNWLKAYVLRGRATKGQDE